MWAEERPRARYLEPIFHECLEGRRSQVQKAFELLNGDHRVKAILVNIFGGIMRCDIIAMGIVNAAKEIGMKKPIIIRY
jgi:succinyl-CoA synthetase beta subunit